MPKKEFNLPMIGGIIAAVGVGLCCVGPFVLLLLGVSGSWISSLTLLEPYRPLFILAIFALFGWAGWKVYRPVEECEPGSACAVPQVRRHRQIFFWVTAFIALALVTSAYWIPFFV